MEYLLLSKHAISLFTVAIVFNFCVTGRALSGPGEDTLHLNNRMSVHSSDSVVPNLSITNVKAQYDRIF